MEVKEFVIDLFCGAGGTSEGVFLSETPSIVTACVNHDAKAIESHRKNHPYAKHFVEDIRNPEVIFFLKLRVNALRKLYPNCKITIWASLECTNFSKAKGGLPRVADSRTLANTLLNLNTYLDKDGKKITENTLRKHPEPLDKVIEVDGYIDALKPDYVMIENVMEFMAWGALDENGKAIASKRGEDYLEWVENVKGRGFKFEWQKINAADLGARTSRSRFFAQFAKGELPIAWPVQTHTKTPVEGDTFDKWEPVRPVLDFTLIGKSVLNRKKPLVDKTLERIYAGLIKFVAKGDDSFIKKYYSGRPMGKVISINGPAGTVTTLGNQALVNCEFMLKYNSTNGKTGKHNPPSVDEPCPTVATQNRLGVVVPEFDFLTGYYTTGGSQVNSTDEPCPTVSTKDRFNQISVFLSHYYSGGGQLSDVNEPHPTIMGVPKSSLNQVEFIYDPSFNNKGRDVYEPCPVVIASQHKKPLGLIVCERAERFAIPVYEEDTEVAVRIKFFMAAYGITDIKMRMLSVEELLRIQGFPSDYELVGNVAERKKFIGNSVEVTTAKKLFEAHYGALKDYLIKVQNVA